VGGGHVHQKGGLEKHKTIAFLSLELLNDKQLHILRTETISIVDSSINNEGKASYEDYAALEDTVGLDHDIQCIKLRIENVLSWEYK